VPKLGYHPKLWKIFIMITLRKPGKPDYTIPKAHHPIALEKTMAKVIESVFTRCLATYSGVKPSQITWVEQSKPPGGLKFHHRNTILAPDVSTVLMASRNSRKI
jgi:hypothetical protein